MGELPIDYQSILSKYIVAHLISEGYTFQCTKGIVSLMKRKSRVSIALPLIGILFAIVAIFCLMAPGFNEASRGTGFVVAFGGSNIDRHPVAGLIIAFALQILVILVAMFSLAVKGKGKYGLLLFAAAAAVASAVLFIFAKPLYIAANAGDPLSEITVTDFKLGAGFITSIIFSFLAGGILALKVYVDRRSDEE